MNSSPSSEALLFAQLTQFVRKVAQQGAEELDNDGLTPAQFQLLVAVKAHPGTPQKALARAFGVTRGNISQLVKKVEDAGLVRRARHQGSDRLELTDAGASLVARLLPARDQFVKRTFAPLTADEQLHLAQLIAKLSRG